MPPRASAMPRAGSRGARRRDHSIAASRPGRITGRSPARSISRRDATGAGRDQAGRRAPGRRAERAARRSRRKVFGEPVFVHDMTLDGMVHARVVRQPRRGATIAADRRGRDPPRREGARSRSSATAISSRSSAPTRRSSKPSRRSRRAMSPGTASTRSTRSRKRRAGCCSSPRSTAMVGRAAGRPGAGGSAPRGDLYPDAHRACLGRAVLRRRRLSRRQTQVWTHSQGVYPLRAALARTLKLDPAAISVKHAQGPGCYGHNGADDAAADAAVIAMRTPGDAGAGALAARGGIRLRAGQPGDGHDGARRARRVPGARPTGRPRSGAAGTPTAPAAAATCSPPRRCPTRRRPPPAAESLGAARRRHPQRRAALRFRREAHRASPDRRDAGADLVAARARRDAQCVCDRILYGRAGRRGRRGPGRLPPVGPRRSAGPRRRRAGRRDERLARCHPLPRGRAG